MCLRVFYFLLMSPTSSSSKPAQATVFKRFDSDFGVVKLVDTQDLKSCASVRGVPVRFRPRAPSNQIVRLLQK